MPRISEYAAVTVPAGTDEFVVNQSGVSKKITLDDIKTYAGGTGSGVVDPTATSDFLVAAGSPLAWAKKTLAETKTILGVTDAVDVAPTASNDFLVASGSPLAWAKKTLAETKTILGVALDPSPDADHSCSGEVFSLTFGATITFSQVLYMGSGGKLLLAKADAASTSPGLYLAAEGGADTESKQVLRSGFIRDDSWSWTVGGAIYLDASTAGAMTQTAPSGSGNQVQLLGFAISATVIDFRPQLITVEIV